QYKANLEVQVHTKQGIATRRLEAYPKLVELCYRTRNMTRDYFQNPQSVSIQDLVGKVRELEDLVFRFRVDLEADHVFVLVHRYKNLAREFYRTAADLQPTESTGNDSTIRDRLARAFTAIDESYAEVVQRLSTAQET